MERAAIRLRLRDHCKLEPQKLSVNFPSSSSLTNLISQPIGKLMIRRSPNYGTRTGTSSNRAQKPAKASKKPSACSPNRCAERRRILEFYRLEETCGRASCHNTGLSQQSCLHEYSACLSSDRSWRRPEVVGRTHRSLWSNGLESG